MSDTQSEDTMTFEPGEEGGISRSRREKLQRISRDFSHIPVRVGTQQSGSIETIRLSAQTLAKQIAEFAPEGREAQIAIEYVMQAKMWATQAISHRE